MRRNRPYTYLGTIRGMCRECRSMVPCRVLEEGGAVYQERLCPSCGSSRALIAEGLGWYNERISAGATCEAPRVTTPVKEGCPRDCGPCAFHASACHLPVLSVTNACNMRCPICFTYNRPDRTYFMGRGELERILDGLIAKVGAVDLVNVTGGEPTLHPEILSLVAECRRPEIGRVTVNSNGLRLAEDEDLCRGLASLGAYVILSLHTLKPDASMRMHGQDVVGAKLRALENLERSGVGTTLLHVMARGLNDEEIGDVLELARERSVVRSITIQTMTFTGQGGKDFGPRRWMPLDGAAAALERTTGGEISAAHFVPHPRAHPLCYSVAYYIKEDGRLRSFTEFLTREELRSLLSGGYLLDPGGGEQGVLRTAIDRLWAQGGDRALLARLRGMVSRLHPPGRALSRFEGQRACEDEILTVYIHAHMDEDTLDLARLVACPDQVPEADGRLVPACAYNLFYRMRDERFSIP